jgi:hypothetical protein
MIPAVIPARAGIQVLPEGLDSRLCRNEANLTSLALPSSHTI